jgi:hypothetical protein
MECGSGKQMTEPRHAHHGWIRCMASMVLFFSSLAGVDSPYPAEAAVYQCRDKAGRTVLTNRPSQLRNCHVISEGTTPPATSSASTKSPQGLPPPIISEGSPAPPYYDDPPMTPDQPPDIEGSPFHSLPEPDPAMSSSTSPSEPCTRGLNPFNPLSAPPCVQSDPSGTNPPEAVPDPVP